MRLALACLVLVGAALALAALRQLDGSPNEPVPLIELRERESGASEPTHASPDASDEADGGAEAVPAPPPAPAGDDDRKDSDDERQPDGEDGDDR